MVLVNLHASNDYIEEHNNEIKLFENSSLADGSLTNLNGHSDSGVSITIDYGYTSLLLINDDK